MPNDIDVGGEAVALGCYPHSEYPEIKKMSGDVPHMVKYLQPVRQLNKSEDDRGILGYKGVVAKYGEKKPKEPNILEDEKRMQLLRGKRVEDEKQPKLPGFGKSREPDKKVDLEKAIVLYELQKAKDINGNPLKKSEEHIPLHFLCPFCSTVYPGKDLYGPPCPKCSPKEHVAYLKGSESKDVKKDEDDDLKRAEQREPPDVRKPLTAAEKRLKRAEQYEPPELVKGKVYGKVEPYSDSGHRGFHIATPHCENCGRLNPDVRRSPHNGYTACCNELVCEGRGMYKWGKQEDPSTHRYACCGHVASNAGKPLPEGSSRLED
jgi:hypothetical protein